MKFDKRKVKSVRTHQNDNGKHWNDGGLIIELTDWPAGSHRMLDTDYCDRIYILWHPDEHVKIEIITALGDTFSTTKKMYEMDVKKALGWVAENLV